MPPSPDIKKRISNCISLVQWSIYYYATRLAKLCFILHLLLIQTGAYTKTLKANPDARDLYGAGVSQYLHKVPPRTHLVKLRAQDEASQRVLKTLRKLFRAKQRYPAVMRGFLLKRFAPEDFLVIIGDKITLQGKDHAGMLYNFPQDNGNRKDDGTDMDRVVVRLPVAEVRQPIALNCFYSPRRGHTDLTDSQ